MTQLHQIGGRWFLLCWTPEGTLAMELLKDTGGAIAEMKL